LVISLNFITGYLTLSSRKVGWSVVRGVGVGMKAGEIENGEKEPTRGVVFPFLRTGNGT